MSTAIEVRALPDVDTPEYRVSQKSGASRETLARNLVEANFHGLRSLSAYVMAGEERRRGFVQDLAQGKLIESCPFPIEIALLRSMLMGLARWQGGGHSIGDTAEAFVNSLRFGVQAAHLSGVIEYEPEVFFRAFQGVEVHRDVPYSEDRGQDARSLDWMDYRVYGIPALEKDLLWDLFHMDASPWADPAPVLSMGQVALPEQRERTDLPLMVGRQRNRRQADGRQMISMAQPGSSFHLALVSGSRSELPQFMPALVGPPPASLPELGRAVEELGDSDHWLVVTYQAPPMRREANLRLVPHQLKVREEE